MVCASTAAVGENKTPVAAVNKAYARIAALKDNPAFIHVVPQERALAHARRLEALGSAERSGLPLYGLTFAVKDNIDVAGLPTTAACPGFKRVPQQSATAVARLVAAGAIVVGKTNLDQFAAGLVGTRTPYGACRNVFDARYISGGSSSGSAVAVASGACAFALGTDTAGSGRVPAAYNGLVGLKPTRGRVSTTGVVPACRTLDCVSVLASGVNEALRVLEVAEGFDATDPYSRTGMEAAVPAPPRIAVPRADQLEFFGDEAYAALFEAALADLERLGGVRVEADFTPFLEAQALLYDGPWLAERLHAIEGRKLELHPVTRAVIEAGRRYSAIDAFRAQYRLAALKRECDALWRNADVLVVPGAPTIYTLDEVEADPIGLNARLGLYTNFVNLLDYAALTVPAGRRPDGIPFGLTFVGPAFSDRGLAALGARFLGETPMPQKNDSVRIAVVGAHLSGMALNAELTERGARLLRAARTAARYRLHRLSQFKPGLVRVSNGAGASVEVEVWEMPAAGFGALVAAIPAPLGIGTLELEDGEEVKGFLCEQYAADDSADISAYGGWRNYLQSTAEGG